MQRIIKAQMWDKMQYLFRKYYDRMLHFVIYCRGDIKVEVFKRAVFEMLKNVPILRSSYRNNFIKPYWVVSEKIEIDKIVKYVETYDYESILNDFLTKSISVNATSQIRFLIIKSKGMTIMGTIANHMCFDGCDLKRVISTLIANYNAYLGYGKKVAYENGRRDYRLVYEKFNEEERKQAMKLFKNVSVVKRKDRVPFAEKEKSDKCMIKKIRLEEDIVSRFKEIGKKNGATLNDLYLSAFFLALYEMFFDEKKPLTIQCMVNLRRHIPFEGKKAGYANHIGFMQCSVLQKQGRFLEMLAEVKNSTNENKKDKFLGLYGLPLLNFGYNVFPHFLSELAISLGYQNPLIGMSNIGLISEKDFEFAETELIDAFITGGIKYKPYMQLAISHCKGVATLTVAIKGNKKDEELVNTFLMRLKSTIYEFVKNN